MLVVRFVPTEVDVKVFAIFIFVAIEFTLVCFGIELRQFLVKQKYRSLVSL
jgi:hypothetical protein